MVELEAPAPVPGGEPAAAAAAAPQAATGDDGIRIHPHVFCFPEKRSVAPDFKRQLLRRLKPEAPDKSTRARVEQLAADLQTARAALLQELGSPPIADVADSVARKFDEYVGLLLALASSPAAAASSEQSQPGGSTPAAALRPSKLRDAVAFEWQDVLFGQQAVTAADAVFELASAVTAVSGWRLRRAAHLCRDSRAGVDSASAAQAYRLVLQAAGGFQFVRDACCPLLLAQRCPSADCSQEAAGAAAQLCLADAQAVTCLRAMAKSNAPALVAALAVDTAGLYRGAAAAAQAAAPGAKGGKLAAAAEWKAAAFQAYACCFQGLALLAGREPQAGAAVRLTEEAKRLAAVAVPLAAAFNRAQPATPAAAHAEFDRDLAICVEAAAAKAKRENEAVYFQWPPAELPPLPPPRRLAAPTPLQLPQPPPALRELLAQDAFAAAAGEAAPALAAASGEAAAAASAAPAGAAAAAAGAAAAKPAAAEQPESSGGASCCRWLLVIIAMPVLALLSVVGAVVWLVLLPVKIICCPIGCLVQLMADLIEYLLKAPFRAMVWASGKPWEARNAVDAEAGQQRR